MIPHFGQVNSSLGRTWEVMPHVLFRPLQYRAESSHLTVEQAATIKLRPFATDGRYVFFGPPGSPATIDSRIQKLVYSAITALGTFRTSSSWCAMSVVGVRADKGRARSDFR